MKGIETNKVVANDDLPIATMVIKEYKNINERLNKTNESLQKANKRLSALVIILLILFAIETTYIILYWDTLHPHAGMIQNKE